MDKTATNERTGQTTMLQATNEQLLDEIIRIQRENAMIISLLTSVLRRQGADDKEVIECFRQALETSRTAFEQDEDRAHLGFESLKDYLDRKRDEKQLANVVTTG
jgi:hypothetical protein